MRPRSKFRLWLLAALEPLRDAVEKISARAPVGSLLRTKEWEAVPLALRERAQFSAGVESVRLLQAIQDRIEGQIKLQRERLDDNQEATFDRSSFIDAIREIARDEGLTPQDPSKAGGLQDITSIRRLGLIYDMQTAQAQGFARWKLDQSEGALLLYPAQEFVRVESRVTPREDWPRRFAEAAEAAGDEDALRIQRDTGRMMALKTSGLWTKLSRFGTPWPPFDFASGMGLEDIDRDVAVGLGLLGEREVLQGAEKDFNEELQASVQGIDDAYRDQLKAAFGNQIKFEGDKVWWNGDRKGKAISKPKPEAPPKPPVDLTVQTEAMNRAVAAGWPEKSAAALKAIPNSLQAELKSANFSSSKPSSGHSGYYRPSGKEVNIASDPNSWAGHPFTAAHEMGHHVHHERGIVNMFKIDPEFQAAIDADNKLFEERWEKIRGKGWRSAVSAARVATAYAITKDIESLYGAGSYHKENADVQHKIAAYADTIGGMTNGRYGWGHARSYYREGNRGAMEVFANAFAALTATPDPVYQESFPNVVAFMRKKLNL